MRFRLETLRPSLVDAERFDLDRAAEVAVSSADPVIDTALRRIGSAWLAAGLDRNALTRPWAGRAVDDLFRQRPDLLDAVDDIVGQVLRLAPCT